VPAGPAAVALASLPLPPFSPATLLWWHHLYSLAGGRGRQGPGTMAG
jgi:hypothetical protein